MTPHLLGATAALLLVSIASAMFVLRWQASLRREAKVLLRLDEGRRGQARRRAG